jgi:coenzyme Q-binding protein COQ10
MFDLVADVERYPQFVPLCESLRVRSRSTDAAGRPVVVAEMGVGYGPIRETFISSVLIDRPSMTITASLLEGPFRHLLNRWRFAPHARGAEVEFLIDYEFKSFALQMLMGAMFDRAYGKYVAAFEARADKVYAKSGTRHEGS